MNIQMIEAAIAELRTAEGEQANALKTTRNAIEALQCVCPHEWHYDGHGHNDKQYTCAVCGLVKWE
jgi:hypothetical protein